jgi:predicted extracellular nuclease
VLSRGRRVRPVVIVAMLAMLASGLVTSPAKATPVSIHDIQGASHLSPLTGPVTGVPGIVTARVLTGSRGFYMQEPAPDADPATSEGIFVFTNIAPTVAVGDSVLVNGTVTEFRSGGGSSTNLSTTEITSPVVTVVSSGNPLPATTVIGIGGRIPPNTVIEDDASGSVETSGVFDPATDGIDFYESLEAMRVQINNAVAVGPRNAFGEIPVLSDDGANGGTRTTRGGIVIQPGDFNPERVILDDVLMSTPNVSVSDHFTTPVVGVMDYNFGNFKLQITSPLTVVSGGLQREVAAPTGAQELAVGTFNLENLDPSDPQSKFDELASLIVNNLRSPDLIAVEEIQDNNGPVNDGVVDADVTFGMLIAAIQAQGGPLYDYRQINPVNNQDGGEPGGNIRVGFLFNSDRGLTFIDRPGGGSTNGTLVVPGPGKQGPQLTFSPGRIDPTNTAWTSSRKPLAGEFKFRGNKLFVIANHFNSKTGDEPLFGRFQPPNLVSEVQRSQQAQVENNFVDSILALDPNANIITLGDFNDFQFSNPIHILEGGVLHDLVDTLPLSERYSYVFDGNSQVLDQILVSDYLFDHAPFVYDVVHANSEFWNQASDHEPQVAHFDLSGQPR